MLSDFRDKHRKGDQLVHGPLLSEHTPLQPWATRNEVQLPRSCHTGETRYKTTETQREVQLSSAPCRRVSKASGDPSPRPASHPTLYISLYREIFYFLDVKNCLPPWPQPLVLPSTEQDLILFGKNFICILWSESSRVLINV